MDGLDDLGAVDPLKVDRGDPEVGVLDGGAGAGQSGGARRLGPRLVALASAGLLVTNLPTVMDCRGGCSDRWLDLCRRSLRQAVSVRSVMSTSAWCGSQATVEVARVLVRFVESGRPAASPAGPSMRSAGAPSALYVRPVTQGWLIAMLAGFP